MGMNYLSGNKDKKSKKRKSELS